VSLTKIPDMQGGLGVRSPVSSTEVQGQSPSSGSGGRSPPEAERYVCIKNLILPLKFAALDSKFIDMLYMMCLKEVHNNQTAHGN